MGLWSLAIKNALPNAGGLQREEFSRLPAEWDPSRANRICKLLNPAYGLNDAPGGFRQNLQRYLLRSEDSPAHAYLKFQISTFGPCLRFVFRGSGGAAGARTTHIDDVRDCGGPGILLKVQKYWGRRFGGFRAQEQNFAHAAAEVPERTISRYS